MNQLPDNMYVSDELEYNELKKPVQPTNISVQSIADVKSFKVKIGNEIIEVVKRSYVDNIDRELVKTRRDLRTAQTRITQLIRAVSVLSSDLSDLRRQINARGRFE